MSRLTITPVSGASTNVTLKGSLIYPDWFTAIPDLSYLAQLIDAASEKAAFIVQAPKTGTISKVLFRTGTVTTGATVDVRLETVSTTDGNPTGTLLGTDSNGSQVIADTDDNTVFTTSLTTGPSVTRGDIFAVVIVNPSVDFGNMQIVGFQSGSAGGAGGRHGIFPYSDLFTTAWTKSTILPVCAFEYSDGTYEEIKGVYPMATVAVTSFNSGSLPDEIGIIFQLPMTVTVYGAWILTGAGANATVKLYDSDGSTVLASYTIDSDLRGGTSGRCYFVTFSSNVTLTKDTNYRLTLVPDTTTSITLSRFTVNAAAVMDAFPGGQNIYQTERTDAGAWTNTTTERPLMGLLINQLQT